MTDSLLLFNLATDQDDPILGFTTTWLNGLASRFERIDVITMRSGRLNLAENVFVHSVGKERGYSEVRRTFEFYRLLMRLLVTHRYAACFAHMMPLFAVMAAPLLKLSGIPITLWYTHRQDSRILRWAAWVSHRVVTAAPDSFPFATLKLRVLGHGVDTDYFEPAAAAQQSVDPIPAALVSKTQQMIVVNGGYVIQVARLMPIKHQATLLRALELTPNVHVVLVGGTPDEVGREYEHKLRGLAHGLDLGGRVVFAGAQGREVVREHYRRASVAVNLSPPGLFDKAVLESMAMELPTIVANPAFDLVLGDYRELLRIGSSEDAAELAAALDKVLALPQDERDKMGRLLREHVIQSHSLGRLIDRLVHVLRTGEP